MTMLGVCGHLAGRTGAATRLPRLPRLALARPRPRSPRVVRTSSPLAADDDVSSPGVVASPHVVARAAAAAAGGGRGGRAKHTDGWRHEQMLDGRGSEGERGKASSSSSSSAEA